MRGCLGGRSRRGWVSRLGIAVLGTLLPAVAAAEHFVYVSPTVGMWRWDKDVYPHITLDEFGPVFGARVGYTATKAFSAELVGLTGTSDAAPVPAGSAASEALRQTLVELSLVVNFQSLAGDRIYPFLDLGTGVALRRGGPATPEQPRIDDDRLAFHLGGGIQMELDSRWALRLNVRDTFFNEDKSVGNSVDRVTVDSLELSVGLTVKIPVGNPGSSSLQLRGIDAGPK